MKLCSIIKNDGPGSCLVWKFLEEDFNNNSQLIVTESEDALFYKDGVIVQSYSGGKYNLETNNIPYFKNLRNKFTGGVSAFSCKVYFINKVHKLDIKWGTDTPILMRDAQFGFSVGVRARGVLSIQVKDSKKFFLKLIGNNIQSFTSAELSSMFRTSMQQPIKVAIAKIMKNQQKTIMDMATEYETIATQLHSVIDASLDEYGMRCVNFNIVDISIPEDDPNYKKINEAYARTATRGIEGINWNQEQAASILGDLAKNPGAGGMAAMGAGMGMGYAAGNAFGNLANQIFAPVTPTQPTAPPVQATSRYSPIGGENANTNVSICFNCNATNASGVKFCSNCGKLLIVKCPNCGATVQNGSKFCNNCGTKI